MKDSPIMRVTIPMTTRGMPSSAIRRRIRMYMADAAQYLSESPERVAAFHAWLKENEREDDPVTNEDIRGLLHAMAIYYRNGGL